MQQEQRERNLNRKHAGNLGGKHLFDSLHQHGEKNLYFQWRAWAEVLAGIARGRPPRHVLDRCGIISYDS